MAAMDNQANKIDGKAIASKIREGIKEKVAERVSAGLSQPSLATVLVGGDPASEVYVRSKHRACEAAGMTSVGVVLDAEETNEKVLEEIQSLNARKDVHGILVQLPLPKHLDEELILSAIDYHKDVDGLHPVNAGRLAQKGRSPLFSPATPSGIMELLAEQNVELEGANVVILGRSNIVGMPVALLMLKANATVTVCHSRSVDIPSICRNADILIASVGIPEMVKTDWIKPGAVIIDVGVNRVEDSKKKRGYRLVGDVDYAGVQTVASAITPVPGGVGPMTIAMLLKNTLIAAELAD
jgi:5,10-methylene-tetrahydrofolate dehydrogenase/methenyl tetrahydrofolate cyclohydrolase